MAFVFLAAVDAWWLMPRGRCFRSWWRLVALGEL
jgi:hypothetical protein